MQRRSLAALLGAATALAVFGGVHAPASAQESCTIALIPGLTTDAFYITMRKGAEMAAKAVGCELLFQGAPEFNPTLQVPVLQAVIARKPNAILIAPTDKQQLIAPLQQAVDAGIPVITVDTFIDDGKYQNGDGPGDFPLSVHIGGVYGILWPNENVATGPGQWQTYDITLIGRRVTVVLNGKTVIADQIIPGITGGALDSAEGGPGPILLQGDHTAVEYRNVRLTPAK